MAQLYAFVVAFLAVGALGEQQFTENLDEVQGNSLMSKGPGKLLEFFQAEVLDDPFADLSDDFAELSEDVDLSSDAPYAPPYVPEMESAVKDPLADTAARMSITRTVTEWLLARVVGNAGAGGFVVDALLYYACVFIVELLLVFAAAGFLQWWRTHASKGIQNSELDCETTGKERTTDRQDDCGCTALHTAANGSSLSEVRACLDNGADVNAREAWEETPLHFAARSGNVVVCELLLQHGASVNPLNSQDATPLLVASHAGKEYVCTLLLDYGAHVGGVKDSEMPMLLNSLLAQRIFNNITCTEAE